jgi:cytochrome c
MRAIGRLTATATLALALSACGSPPEEQASEGVATPTETASATTAAAGDGAPAAFAQCKTCHAVEKDKHGVGPSLFGVYGTKAGEITGFAFSAAMKNSGLTWDDATLDEYLTAPMKKIPGTKMSYAGQSDPAKRKEIIEYMKTLK